MKKISIIFFAAMLLVGVSARAATTTPATYSGVLPGSFQWNVNMWLEGTWQGVLGVFDKQAQIDYINKRISERNTELVGITTLVDSGTFTSSSSVQELQNAHDIAAGAYLQDQVDLAQAEKTEPSPSVFQNSVAYDPESMVDHWMKQRDALLRAELQDQTNGSAANLLQDQANLSVVNQIIAKDDAGSVSEEEAVDVAKEKMAQYANEMQSANYWIGVVQDDEGKAIDGYKSRGVTPNADASAIQQQLDAMIAGAQKDMKAGDNDKANVLVPQMRQLMENLWTVLQQQYEDNDAAQGAAGNQTPPSQAKQTAPQPASQSQTKPVLKTIPSESVATSPLEITGDDNLNATVGEPFEASFDAEGGLPPYHFQLETGVGFPPQQIVLDTNGALSGTPSAPGTATFGACVLDTAGKENCETVTMTVEAATLTITGDDNLDGTVGDNLNANFDAQGGTPPYQFSVGPNSALPAGLVLDANGALSGTPAAAGTSDFDVCAKDSAGTNGCESVTVTVAAPEFCPPCQAQYDACWQTCDDTYHACNDAVPIGAVDGEEMQSKCWDTLGSCDNTCSEQQDACLKTASPSCTNEPWQ